MKIRCIDAEYSFNQLVEGRVYEIDERLDLTDDPGGRVYHVNGRAWMGERFVQVKADD